MFHDSRLLKGDRERHGKRTPPRRIAQKLDNEFLSRLCLRNLCNVDRSRLKLRTLQYLLEKRPKVRGVVLRHHLTPKENANRVAANQLKLSPKCLLFGEVRVYRHGGGSIRQN